MLIDHWFPVTSDVGLLRADMEQAIAALLAWHAKIDIQHRRTNITSSLSDALNKLPPLAHRKEKRLFVRTKSEWIAYFANGIQGGDPAPMMNQLANTLLHTQGMRVCTSDTATIWEVYAPQSLGGSAPLGFRRTIYAAKDGKWQFGESGDRFPFEDTTAYTASRIRDRFTKSILKAYLREFGLRPFDDDFYIVDQSNPAVLLEEVPIRWETPTFTLEQVKAGVPWRKSSG